MGNFRKMKILIKIRIEDFFIFVEVYIWIIVGVDGRIF
jgi:hypothetical protein